MKWDDTVSRSELNFPQIKRCKFNRQTWLHGSISVYFSLQSLVQNNKFLEWILILVQQVCGKGHSQVQPAQLFTSPTKSYTGSLLGFTIINVSNNSGIKHSANTVEWVGLEKLLLII